MKRIIGYLPILVVSIICSILVGVKLGFLDGLSFFLLGNVGASILYVINIRCQERLERVRLEGKVSEVELLK